MNPVLYENFIPCTCNSSKGFIFQWYISRQEGLLPSAWYWKSSPYIFCEPMFLGSPGLTSECAFVDRPTCWTLAPGFSRECASTSRSAHHRAMLYQYWYFDRGGLSVWAKGARQSSALLRTCRIGRAMKLDCSTAVCCGFTHKHGSAWKLCCSDPSSPWIMPSVFGVLSESTVSSYLSPHPKCLANSTLMFALVALGGAGSSENSQATGRNWRRVFLVWYHKFIIILLLNSSRLVTGILASWSAVNKGRERSFLPPHPC